MQGISKRFPGVQALRGVNFSVQRGEIHALLGENGAGKSTLLKIITGVYQLDAGQIFFKSQPVNFGDPGEAQRAGISVIYQECNLIEHLTVAENIYLGNEPRRVPGLPLIDREQMRVGSQAVLDRLNLALDPDEKVGELSPAEQQMVEIARALHLSTDLVLLDEPTAALSSREVATLFSAIRVLRAQGVAVVYISHRLEEVLQICNRATILRDGRTTTTLAVDQVSLDELIQLMVGKRVADRFPKVSTTAGPEVLRVEGLSRAGAIEDVSFSLYAGEILGITGLVGAGGTAVLRAIFGADPISAGNIYVDGEPVEIKSPQQAIAHGIGLLTEDRQSHGLVLDMSAQDNMTLAVLDNAWPGPFIDRVAEDEIVNHYALRLGIRSQHLTQKTLFLSGGTQQKVVLSKWLATSSRVLLFDEPTQGVDVGARVEIYRLMNDLVHKGMGIILVSADVNEILGMCDRIIVLHQGRIATVLPREVASQQQVLTYANGGFM